MKPLKITSLFLLGALALGADSAKAQLVTANYLKVNFSLIIQQQALYDTNKNGDGKTYIWTIDKMKVDNKALLEFMAEMFDTSWPDGAQLKYVTDSEQLIVTDKTGDTVLFYCGDGVDNTNRYAYVDVNWTSRLGPYSGKRVEPAGPRKYTGYWQGTIHIHYENFSDSSVYTDFSGNGLDVENYFYKEPSSGPPLSLNETFTPFAVGTSSDEDAILTGKMTAKGKVSGLMVEATVH